MEGFAHDGAKSYSVVFRKASPVNSTGRLMPGDCWSDGIRSCAPIFFLTVWFQRERAEALLSVSIMRHVLRSMLMSEGRE
jgi:hypothetical protein